MAADADAAAAADDALWARMQAGGAGQSAQQMLRAVRRDELCLLHRLLSIREDNAFVASFAARVPFPLYANLRCGLWYVRPGQAAGTCYFKSADGHARQWKFNTTRLNLHLAQRCADDGGAVVVDSTRKGKRFPDSFTRTMPIWACVVNRAVARLREADGDGGDSGDSDTNDWDTALHMPPQIPESERAQVLERVPAWVDALLAVPGGGLRALAASLRRPLRCLWFSRDSRLPEGGDAGYEFAAFTPLLCVSVSAVAADGGTGAPRSGWHYVQGAGDDEESWSLGLVPRTFWEHEDELLARGLGIDECAEAARRVVAAGRAGPGGGGGGGGLLESLAGAPVAIGETRLWIAEWPGAAATSPEPAAGDPLWQSFDAAVVAAADGEPPAAGAGARWRAFRAGTGAKDDKDSLSRCAGALSEHALARARAGERVLLVAPTLAVAAAVAVCVLVAGYDDDARLVAGGGAAQPRATKQSIRHRLAYVQSFCPQGVYPARNLMKQLNRYFLSVMRRG